MNPVNPVLTIDLAALSENYRILQAKSGPQGRTAAVVKANAYGLGAKQIVSVFNKLKCNDYFVFTPAEGIELRPLLPTTNIYILNGYPPGWETEYIAHNLIPCLSTPASIRSYAESAGRAGRKLPAAIQFDTGMNRLGLGADETQKLLENSDDLKSLDLKLIMSHFASADEKNDPLTQTQFNKFSAIAKHFPGIKKSLSNSSGIFRSPAFHFDLLRPGMALYGLNPTPETANPMRPVVKLEAPILQLRNAKKGEIVGYSATYKFKKDTPMATIWLGYADGFLRSLSGKGKHGGTLYWKNYPCPIRGRVSMDLVTVSLENIPAHERPHEGDMLEVIGPNQTADDLAAAAGTIGYEILTSLGSRYRREYIG